MNRETRLLGWHYEWTAGQLTSLGSLFILLLAPLLSWLWPWLARRGLNPSKPLKSALGLMVAGLAFLVLVWSARHPQGNGLTAFWRSEERRGGKESVSTCRYRGSPSH